MQRSSVKWPTRLSVVAQAIDRGLQRDEVVEADLQLIASLAPGDNLDRAWPEQRREPLGQRLERRSLISTGPRSRRNGASVTRVNLALQLTHRPVPLRTATSQIDTIAVIGETQQNTPMP